MTQHNRLKSPPIKHGGFVLYLVYLVLLLSGCGQGDKSKTNSVADESKQVKVAKKDDSVNINSKPTNAEFNKYFSRDRVNSNLKIENLSVSIPLNDYDTNVYSLGTSSLAFAEGDCYFFKPNKSVTLLITAKNKIPVLMEVIDDKGGYKANNLYYYSRFNIDPYLKNRVVSGLELSANQNQLEKYFIKEGVRSFTTTIVKEGASGPIEVESQTNINVISFSSCREYPFGLESFVPWRYPYPPQFNTPRKGGPTLEDFQPKMMMFYRKDQNDYLIRLDGESSHETDNKRFAEQDVAIWAHQPGLFFAPASSEVVDGFRTARKAYSPKSNKELIQIKNQNESFERCINLIIEKAVAFTDRFKDSSFNMDVKQLNRFSGNRNYHFKIRTSNPFKLLPWSSDSFMILDGLAEAADEDVNPLKWDIYIPSMGPNGSRLPYKFNSKGRSVFSTEFPDRNKMLSKHIENKSNVKLVLKCEWGKNAVFLHFVKPGHPIEYQPGSIPVVASCTAFDQKINFEFQSKESPDGLISFEDNITKVDELENKLVVLVPKNDYYELKGYDNVIFKVVK